MRRFISFIFRKCERVFLYVYYFFRSFPSIFHIANKSGYYPEVRRKPYIRRLADNFLWVLRYNEPNDFYTLYGLDTYTCALTDLISNSKAIAMRNERNCPRRASYNYIAILRDKLLFYKFLSQMKVPTPDVFAVYYHGQLYSTNMLRVPEETLENEEDYFLKDIGGECASFVKHVKDHNELKQLLLKHPNGTYILQKRAEQCGEMDRINPYSINTIRLVTVMKDGEPTAFSAVLRVGTSKTEWVDNWAHGGLSIGVEDNGFLKKYGYYKPQYGTKASSHPDTGIVFSEFQIPHYSQIVQSAIDLHRALYGIHSIGWDIAVTDEGACFIEGNDNWEISLMQACNGGLKTKWMACCK